MFTKNLKSGDIVKVLPPLEILKTLDSEGTLNNLPFMPEMISCCGKIYKVRSKLEKTCVTCLASNNLVTDKMKEFVFNDVVLLDELRCSGNSHGDCQIGCMILWKEAWLKKSNGRNENISINQKDIDELKKQLKIRENDGRYFCQATQLNISTVDISKNKRRVKLLKEMFTGEIKFYTGVKSIVKPTWRKLRPSTLIKGRLTKTPTYALNLQPGELVEVKSFDEILETLDQSGMNRGLRFYYDLKQHCGKKFKVRNRLDRMINEATGEMVEVKNTVILENVNCTYEYQSYGCPRSKFHYWREIWLKRIS